MAPGGRWSLEIVPTEKLSGTCGISYSARGFLSGTCCSASTRRMAIHFPQTPSPRRVDFYRKPSRFAQPCRLRFHSAQWWRVHSPVLQVQVPLRWRRSAENVPWYLDGSSHVFRELRRANVPMSPQLVQYVDEWLAEFPAAEPWPNANKRKGRLGPVLALLALTLSLGLHFWPESPRKVYQESRALSPEVTAQRARLLEEMNQVQIEMNAAMRRYQEGPPKNRMQELDHFTELSNQFDEITKKYDALWSDTP